MTLTLEGLFFFILLVLLLSHIISKVVRHGSVMEECYMFLETKLVNISEYRITK